MEADGHRRLKESEQSDTPAAIEINEINGPQERSRSRSRHGAWLWLAISQFLGLLWLAPAITLLVLNFNRFIVGASVACSGGVCSLNIDEEDFLAKSQQLDKRDHNVLGALQVASKSLEIWFMFVAVSLVYDVGILLARRGGLPVGYIMMHLEFGDIRSLFHRDLWASAMPARHDAGGRKRFGSLPLYAFVALVVVLCAIVNLMGPAAAILILPSLQWIDRPPKLGPTFDRLALADLPMVDTIAVGCNTSALAQGDYSCTGDLYASALDSWLEAGVASQKQYRLPNQTSLIPSISQEGSVAFTINYTSSSDQTLWAPNRQVLRELSNDFVANFVLNSTDGELYSSDDPVLSDTIGVVFHRTGPIIGLILNLCTPGNVSKIAIADDKEIRCYALASGYSECVRLGPGWNENNTHSQFFLGDGTSAAASVSVDVYFADRRNIFNSTSPLCSTLLPNGQGQPDQQCDWDQIFSTNTSDILTFPTKNVEILEFFVPNITTATSNQRVFCELAAQSKITRYDLDASPDTNPLQLVRQTDFSASPADDETIVMNPDWILAGWSVRVNGTVDGTRGAAEETVRSLKRVLTDPDTVENLLDLTLLNVYAGLQAMSMVNYYTNTGPASAAHPALQAYITTHVWAYGIETRTGRLGVTVIIIGCLLVLLRTAVGLVARSGERSTPELLVAALEHRDPGAFHRLSSNLQKSKVRYEVRVGEDDKTKFVLKNE